MGYIFVLNIYLYEIWLQKRIFSQGLKPSMFFTKPFEKAFKNLPKDIAKAFALDMEKGIVLGVKK